MARSLPDMVMTGHLDRSGAMFIAGVGLAAQLIWGIGKIGYTHAIKPLINIVAGTREKGLEHSEAAQNNEHPPHNISLMEDLAKSPKHNLDPDQLREKIALMRKSISEGQKNVAPVFSTATGDQKSDSSVNTRIAPAVRTARLAELGL